MQIKPEHIGKNGHLLLKYWESLCTPTSIPSWDDMKISALAPIASRVVVFEITEKSGAQIIFSGNEIDLRLKREVMGNNTKSFGTMDEQLKVMEISRGNLMTPCASISDYFYRGSPNDPVKRGINFVLPLLNTEGLPRLLILTDDWSDETVEESVVEAIENGSKKVGYVSMINDYIFYDVGFGVPQ